MMLLKGAIAAASKDEEEGGVGYKATTSKDKTR